MPSSPLLLPPRARSRHRFAALAAATALGLTGLVALNAPAAHADAGPAATTVYTADSGSGTVTAINTATGAVVATVPVGTNPSGVAEDAARSHVYVANTGDGTVSVIDTATDTVTAVVPGFAHPFGLAVTPDGGRVYVTNESGNTVSVIDTATDTVSGGPITVGANPFRVTVSPDGADVYVSNSGSNSVSVISTASGAVTATVPVGPSPVVLRTNPAGTLLYVANQGGNSVSVIDTAADAVIGTIPVGSIPQGLAVSPDGSQLYVTDQGDNAVSVVSTATGAVTATIAVGANPVAVAFDSTGAHAFVADYNDSAVSVVDTAAQSVTGTVSTGTHPYDLAPDGVLPPPVPVVASVSPDSGPPAGGTVVTVSGSHLAGAAISFGGRPATDVSCTATSCTATSPAGTAPDTVDVRATTPDGTSAVSGADHFSYSAADVGVTLTATAVPGLLVGKINYTLTVTNHGPSALTAAAFGSGTLRGAALSSSDCAVSGGVSGGSFQCTVAGVAVGASVTRHLTASFGTLTVGLPWSLTMSRTSSSPVDLVPSDNSATRTCTIVTTAIITC
ncbi:beta-propeller fold lactonase family protein [Streptacidiphilus sp. N1-12]|uniref:Beta-propeller fold lactonase family protein n=2 Tax=Streptacidiphilus alkalitolerans TaxID=3342712 RepID=A0ABV6VCB7_9ACTN